MVAISMTGSNTVIKAVLRSLDAETRTTQNRIATGLKVASYSDDASVWSTAQGLRSDIKLTDGIKSDISIAKGRADVASAALKSITDRLGEMKEQVNLAMTAGASATTIDAAVARVNALVTQVSTLLDSGTFKGTSYLKSAGAQTINIGVDAGTTLTTSFTSENIAVASGNTGKLIAASVTSTTILIAAGTANSVIDFVNNALTQVNAYSAKVQGLSDSLANQQDFLTTLNDIRSKAIGSMVDADLEEESARSKALEVRQQLAYQALAIGGNSQQNILLLFR